MFGINLMIVLSQNRWPLNKLCAGSVRLIKTKNICKLGVAIEVQFNIVGNWVLH